MDTKEKQIPQPAGDLILLAEAMLLTEKELPSRMPEDLVILRQMLEDAVKGEDGTDTPAPVPPGYGKIMYPAGAERERGLCLREDTVTVFPESLTALSPRQSDVYVAVPQVVGQGGNT
ncbi:MAG: hypothetical protein IKV57_09715 [Clostridia bacterium]|nr:hypothetical protein [Clostridia bacterium]